MESFYDIVSCPLNEDHRVLRGRLATHIDRCTRRAGKEAKNFLICPYNMTHRILVAEMENHMKVCENRSGSIELLSKEEGPKQEQVIPLQAIAECEEDWDLEPDVGTYKPKLYCQNNLIVRNLRGHTQAARKEFRENERRRFADLMKKQEKK